MSKILQLKEALRIKATEHISFKEALNRVSNLQNPTSVTTDITYSQAVQTPSQYQKQISQLQQLNDQSATEIEQLKKSNQTQQNQITDLQNQITKLKESNDSLIPNVTKLPQDHQKHIQELINQKISFSENQHTIRICQLELSLQRLYETVHKSICPTT